MKLEKVNKELYATKDTKYVLRKSARIYPPKGIRKVWKLYCDGNYIGCPETIADANKMIKQHEEYLEKEQMDNEYIKSVDKLLECNDYREKDNDKRLDKLLDDLKNHISNCGSCNSAVGFCRQFLHDVEYYEQQNAHCGEVRRNLMELKIKFEGMEEN